MKPHDAAALLGIATSTIRSWSIGEFKPYLSPTGQGGEGRFRDLTEHDVRVLAFIAGLKNRSVSRDDIHNTLKQLQVDDWRDLPPMPTAPPGVAPISLIPREAAETAVATQREAMRREIEVLNSRVQTLEAQLEAERTRREEEGRSATVAREDLIRQLAEAQTELRMLREGWRKPE